MLAITWFLSAGLQWGQEAIDVKATYLHGIVWTLASVQTTAVLILKKIEGKLFTEVKTSIFRQSTEVRQPPTRQLAEKFKKTIRRHNNTIFKLNFSLMAFIQAHVDQIRFQCWLICENTVYGTHSAQNIL